MKKHHFLFIFILLNVLVPKLVFGQLEFENKNAPFKKNDFSNWEVLPKEQEKSWTIKNGVLLAKSDAAETGSNLWTKDQYEDFVLRLEFKMGSGRVDSGVFLRGEDPQSPQIQIGISGSLKVDMTGSPYVPTQGYPKKAEVDKILKKKEWNVMTILAVKNTYKVWLNDLKVLDYTLENASLKGPIGLQLHPNRTMDIQFKRIFIKKL